MAETIQTAQVAKEITVRCQKVKGQEGGGRSLEEELSRKTGARQSGRIGIMAKAAA